MSGITLLDVVENLKISYNLTAYQSKKCDEFFVVIQPGDFIYPGHLKSKLLVDIKTAYFFMEDLKKEGFVTNIYEVYCKQCQKVRGFFWILLQILMKIILVIFVIILYLFWKI